MWLFGVKTTDGTAGTKTQKTFRFPQRFFDNEGGGLLSRAPRRTGTPPRRAGSGAAGLIRRVGSGREVADQTGLYTFPNTKKPSGFPKGFSMMKAAAYSPGSNPSTIGAAGLNFSVRDGKRWDPCARPPMFLMPVVRCPVTDVRPRRSLSGIRPLRTNILSSFFCPDT